MLYCVSHAARRGSAFGIFMPYIDFIEIIGRGDASDFKPTTAMTSIDRNTLRVTSSDRNTLRVTATTQLYKLYTVTYSYTICTVSSWSVRVRVK
jgi:hypothetical protein